MPTPRSNPNYNVHLSTAKIISIVSKSLDDVDPEEITVEPLPSGKSFNNRIYYVNIQTKLRSGEESLAGSVCSNASDTGDDESLERTTSRRTPATTSYALKVIGRGFDARKIQNEIACLLLLEKYCPSLTVPRVLSWSEDGEKVQTRSDPQGSRPLDKDEHAPIKPDSRDKDRTNHGSAKQGWMLLSRVPGRIVSPRDLVGPHRISIMRQMGTYVADWRKNLPRGKAIGNLVFVPQTAAASPAATLYVRSILPGMDVYIQGRLTDHVQPTHALTTHLQYVTHRLNSAIHKLEEFEIYDYIRDPMTNLIRNFMTDTLPHLDISLEPDMRRRPDCKIRFTEPWSDEKSMFAHYDLSPRNVLVTESKNGELKVSAVLDLEFSGLFPVCEEFTNTLCNNAEDWSKESYAIFLSELRGLGALPECLAHARFCCGFDGMRDDEKRDDLSKEEQEELIPFGDPVFHQSCLIMRIIENLAPWWVKTTCSLTEDELRQELTEAYNRVKRAIQSLEAMCNKVYCREENMEMPEPAAE